MSQGGAELRGSKVPKPSFRLGELPEGLTQVRGYRDIQTFFPSLGKLLNLNAHPKGHVWLDTRWNITGIDCSGAAGPCTLSLQNAEGEKKTQRAFLKVTHLLDPVRWIRGEYSLPDHPMVPKNKRTWKTTVQKLTDPWNQAYVESIAAYALGRLREEGASPHFNVFYGAFQAKADVYQYNLTDDYDSYRHSRWFWVGHEKRFRLRMINAEEPGTAVDEALLEYLKPPTSLEDSDSDSDSGETNSGSSAASEAEELELVEATQKDAEIQSLHSGDGEMEVATVSDASGSEEESGSEDSSEISGVPEHKIYAEIPEYPVMLIASEENEGTLDSLFEDYDAIGCSPGTPEWDYHWSAWMFQVIAALSTAQAILGMTHNDLHTNNIVWTATKEEFLYYKNRAGATFKVPTYGKLFRLIDFGRSIFQINGVYYISDDFRSGNDADGQYSFKPLVKFPQTVVAPNPSFDLVRLAVSMFDTLFPDTPDPKEGGVVLSKEESLEVHESIFPLFNCMWRWMIDDEGSNVLVNPDGSERFPDFDLYKHIAAYNHKAIPSQQFTDPAFDRFQVAPAEAEVEGVKCWSLFC